jgi:hypothetical protein
VQTAKLAHTFLTDLCATLAAEAPRIPLNVHTMKPQPFMWITAGLAVLVIVLWWRQESLQGELTDLRAQIAQQSQPVIRSGVLSQGAPSFDGRSSSESRIAVPVNEDSSAERIADLERVVNGQADILEQLLSQLSTLTDRSRRASARSWGPEQAVGPPDTMTAGDQHTAWAPASSDGGVEWLEAEFANPAEMGQVIVRQTCNPGCITKLVAVTDSGAEVPIWEGQDPSKGQSLANTPFAVPAGINARRVRVYVDTSKMPGWEEIDAVQLIGRDGSRQWANSVNASSTYAAGAMTLTENSLELLGDTTRAVYFDLSGGTRRADEAVFRSFGPRRLEPSR